MVTVTLVVPKIFIENIFRIYYYFFFFFCQAILISSHCKSNLDVELVGRMAFV